MRAVRISMCLMRREGEGLTHLSEPALCAQPCGDLSLLSHVSDVVRPVATHYNMRQYGAVRYKIV